MNILYLAMENARWVTNLCYEIAEQGHDITCLIQTVDDYNKGIPFKEHKNMEIISMEYVDFLNIPQFEAKHFSKLKNKKFDIVFGSHSPCSALVRTLANTFKIPWGVMLLDIPTDLMHIERFRMKQWLNWFDILKYADTMVFNTFMAKDEYEKYTHQWFPDDNVITYATNFIPEYKNTGINIQGDYVISVCRLHPNKNLRIVPTALSLTKTIKKFMVIGYDNGDGVNVREECNKHGIEFIHKTNVTDDEKFKLIRDSAMLIYPQKTPYIGGLSPFEGLYVGKPVIVPDLKVMKDLFLDIPIYFNNNDPESLADAISIALERNVDKDIKEFASMFAEMTASQSKMAQSLLKIMDKTIKTYRG